MDTRSIRLLTSAATIVRGKCGLSRSLNVPWQERTATGGRGTALPHGKGPAILNPAIGFDEKKGNHG